MSVHARCGATGQSPDSRVLSTAALPPHHAERFIGRPQRSLAYDAVRCRALGSASRDSIFSGREPTPRLDGRPSWHPLERGFRRSSRTGRPSPGGAASIDSFAHADGLASEADGQGCRTRTGLGAESAGRGVPIGPSRHPLERAVSVVPNRPGVAWWGCVDGQGWRTWTGLAVEAAGRGVPIGPSPPRLERGASVVPNRPGVARLGRVDRQLGARGRG